MDWAPTKEGLEKDETPTLVVLHGLTGGSYESYIRCLLEMVSIKIIICVYLKSYIQRLAYIPSIQLSRCCYELSWLC